MLSALRKGVGKAFLPHSDGYFPIHEVGVFTRGHAPDFVIEPLVQMNQMLTWELALWEHEDKWATLAIGPCGGHACV